jgi:hypothetical protein
MLSPDPDIMMLIGELAALDSADRAAIVARLPAYQRAHIDRSVALLSAGDGVTAIDRFSPAIAARLAGVTGGAPDRHARDLTVATRATLLRALADIGEAVSTAADPRRGHAGPSLVGALVGRLGRRRG